MFNFSQSSSSGSTRSWPNWFNTVVPLVPIAIAIAVAFVAARYNAPSEPTVEHNSGIDIGQLAPDFTLPDERSHDVQLTALTSKKSVLLVFYLGYDCPRCVRNLRDLADHQDEFNNANVQILAISPDTPEKSRKAINQYGGYPFPLLSDADSSVAAAYGLTLPRRRLLHGAFLVDHQNKITFAVRSDRPYDNLPALMQRIRDQQP